MNKFDNTAALKRMNDRKRSKSKSLIVGRILQYILLTILAAFLIFPFVLMIERSFMPDGDYSLIPTKFTLANWKSLFKTYGYATPLWNTVKIVVFNVIAVPIASSFCAYSFARTQWKGKELVFALVLATLMIPGTITQIPLYVMFSKLNWLNSAKPLTIPALFGGGAINIFLFRQFMRGVPKELEEAAKIDGANALQRYAVITLPLCKPILLFVAVGAFSGNWSDFMSPLIYMTSEDSYTLAVAIYQNTVGVSASAINVRMAAGTFMSILPAVIFLLFQRSLVDGIAVGAVKG